MASARVVRSSVALGLLAGSLTVVPDGMAQPSAAGPATEHRALDAGQMVRRITLAHDDGTDTTERRVWEGRVGRNGRARALLDATVARLNFRYGQAERLYVVAAEDSASAVGAWATMGQAAIVSSRGRFSESYALLEKSGARLLRLGDRAGHTEALLSQALLALRLRGLDAASALLREADSARPPGDSLLQVRAHCVALQVQVRAGTSIPDSVWGRARREAAPHGPRLRAECAFTQAQYLESIGRAFPAIALLDTVATEQQRARMWAALSATRQWQGSTLLARGYYARARSALTEALALAHRSGSANGEAWATQELGRIALRLGATGDAARFFATARQGFLDSDDRTGLAFADRLLADAALLRGELTTADSMYRSTTASLDRLAPTARVQGLVALAEIARRTGDARRSAALLDSATVFARVRNLPGWTAEIRYQRALVALANNEPSQALKEWGTLLRSQGTPGPGRFEVLSRMSEALALGGQVDSAWSTFGEAARTLDRWSATLRKREDSLAALQDRIFDWDRDLGLATAVHRVAMGGRVPEALAMAEWRRVRSKRQVALQRSALAVTGTGTIRGVAQSGDSTLLDARRLPALARARLAAEHAVVNYVVGRGGEPSVAFLLTRDTLRVFTMPPIDSLEPRIERFAGFVQAGRIVPVLANELSDALLAPILAALPNATRRLIVVPDGVLHRLPFAALPHPSGEVVATHLELAIAPSVDDALGSAPVIARRSLAEYTARPLLVGTPRDMPRIPGTDRTWAALPGARAEVRAVRELLADATVIDGAAATLPTVAEAFASGGPVLHVATHAVADPTSFERNGIILQTSGNDDGVFTLPALQATPLPFDLVVLSACASGDGVLLAGQSLHGLVSTALDAGARGVVATRWRLDDEAIVPLMVALYRRLLMGDDAVAALHAVRREAIELGVSPAVWANLDYYGDPTLQLRLRARSPSWWQRMGERLRGWLGGRRTADHAQLTS